MYFHIICRNPAPCGSRPSCASSSVLRPPCAKIIPSLILCSSFKIYWHCCDVLFGKYLQYLEQSECIIDEGLIFYIGSKPDLIYNLPQVITNVNSISCLIAACDKYVWWYISFSLIGFFHINVYIVLYWLS